MESTAINTVYCIMHIVGDDKEDLQFKVETRDGRIWYIYAREDMAISRCKELNDIIKYDDCEFPEKFIVFGKILF